MEGISVKDKNRKLITMMTELKKYLSQEQFYLQSEEYVTVRKLQQVCIRNGLTLKSFLFLCAYIVEILEEGVSAEDEEYRFADIIALAEIIRKEKKITKAELRKRLEMDRGNFGRFFSGKQRTTGMNKLGNLCSAIETLIPDFFARLDDYLAEKKKAAEKEEQENCETEDEKEEV